MYEVSVGALHQPGVCFLCESAPAGETRMVDTTRLYDPAEGWSHLTGAKYVCSLCVGELIKALVPEIVPSDAPAF